MVLFTELAVVVGARRAATISGVSRSGYYRKLRPAQFGPRRPRRSPVNALSPEQLAALQSEGLELPAADVAMVLGALSTRVDAAIAELRAIDVAILGDFRGVGRAQLPSTVIGCLVHGAEHAMRHVGQLSVTARIVRAGMREV